MGIPRGVRRDADLVEVATLQTYLVQWDCRSCGRRHEFRHALQEEDGWPNKFELTCENPDCGQEQDVPFRACTVTFIATEAD